MRRVSLVLGSGGARGLAHIGVIRWLLAHGYTVAGIAGASIGALIGGIHAAGKLEVYAHWVQALERMHVLRLLDPTFGRPGLFKGERVIQVLRELIGDCAIEELPIAFTAVATDLATGEEVWLREGRLFDAIRASIATPLVFTPFLHGQRLLLDGALVNPVPIAAANDHDADLCVVVDLSGPARAGPPPATGQRHPAEAGERSRISRFIDRLQPGRAASVPVREHGLLNVAFVSMQAMQDTLSKLRQAPHRPDVRIEIPRDACSFFEFWRAQELIALGYDCASQAFAQRQLFGGP